MHSQLFGFAFLGSLLLALAGAQTRPKISETFELNAVVEVQSKDSGRYIGEIFWAADPSAGKTLMRQSYGSFTPLTIFSLDQFNLKKQYYITSADGNVCSTNQLDGKPLKHWDWIEKAQFTQNITVEDKTFSIWSYLDKGVLYEVGVPANNPNTLVYYSLSGVLHYYRLSILRFSVESLHYSVFDVPKQCDSGTYSESKPRRPVDPFSTLPHLRPLT